MATIAARLIRSEDPYMIKRGRIGQLASEQEVPGFQIGFVLVAGAVWGEGDVALEAGGDAGGEDVPEVLGDDVGGDEIHQALGRALAAIVGDMAAVASADDAHGGLDLHAQHAAVMFDHEVVRGGVSPGFGNHYAVFGGSGHEAEFDPLAA